MGEADRYSEYKRPKRKILIGSENNAIIALLTVNIIFFLLLLTIKVVYYYFQADKALFQNEVIQYFAMPAQFSHLSKHPWTILTQMFTHIEVLHILSNMLWLWAFGYILQQLAGNRKLIPIYIYGGLMGAVFFIAANYFIPSLKPFIEQSYLTGGNASTMAVAMATTMLAPKFRFFRHLNGGIPIWVLTTIYILIDIAGAATFSAAQSLAHLGGAFAGLLFVVFLRKGNDTSIWMNNLYDWFMNLFNPNKNKETGNVREKIFYNTGGRKPYTTSSTVTQQRIDEILDKINQRGYHFLTDEEKNILKKASEEDL